MRHKKCGWSDWNKRNWNARREQRRQQRQRGYAALWERVAPSGDEIETKERNETEREEKGAGNGETTMKAKGRTGRAKGGNEESQGETTANVDIGIALILPPTTETTNAAHGTEEKGHAASPRDLRFMLMEKATKTSEENGDIDRATVVQSGRGAVTAIGTVRAEKILDTTEGVTGGARKAKEQSPQRSQATWAPLKNMSRLLRRETEPVYLYLHCLSLRRTALNQNMVLAGGRKEARQVLTPLANGHVRHLATQFLAPTPEAVHH